MGDLFQTGFGALLFLALGSFAAGVASRVPVWLGGPGRSAWRLVAGRSSADCCGARLKVVDLAPIASWLRAGGRCRHCGARISPAYPIIEAVSVAAFLVARIVTPSLSGAIAAALILGLMAMAVWIDLGWLLLPDFLTLPIGGLGLTIAGWAPIYPGQTASGALAAAALSGGLLAAVRWAFARLRRREGLGLGDVKLAMALSTLVGPFGVGPMIVVAAGATLIIALLGGHPAGGLRIPFGPGLCVAAVLVACGRHYGIPLAAGAIR